MQTIFIGTNIFLSIAALAEHWKGPSAAFCGLIVLGRHFYFTEVDESPADMIDLHFKGNHSVDDMS